MCPSAIPGAITMKRIIFPPKKPQKRRHRFIIRNSVKILGTQYANPIMMVMFRDKEINNIIHFLCFLISKLSISISSYISSSTLL